VLLTVGLLGIPAVLSIALQSRILNDQVRVRARDSVKMSGRDLLTSRTMIATKRHGERQRLNSAT
jgi:hypothetical protein